MNDLDAVADGERQLQLVDPLGASPTRSQSARLPRPSACRTSRSEPARRRAQPERAERAGEPVRLPRSPLAAAVSSSMSPRRDATAPARTDRRRRAHWCSIDDVGRGRRPCHGAPVRLGTVTPVRSLADSLAHGGPAEQLGDRLVQLHRVERLGDQAGDVQLGELRPLGGLHLGGEEDHRDRCR